MYIEKVIILKQPLQSILKILTMLFHTNKKTYLIKPIKITLVKRNMWSTGTIMKLQQKAIATRMLANYMQELKQGPLIHEKLIELSMIHTLLDPQICQQITTVTYPKLEFPLDKVRAYLPDIVLHSHTNKMNWDQLLSAINFHHVKSQSFFKQGTLYSLGNQNIHVAHTQIQKMQTGQRDPDALYQFDRKTSIWYRYYDWKTGNLKSDSGHVYATSDEAQFEEMSEYILKKQAIIYCHNPLLGEFLKTLKNKSDITWGQRNLEFQEYLLSVMHKLPTHITPSLVFKTSLVYDADHAQSFKPFEGIVNLNSFCDVPTSQGTVAKALVYGGSKIITNYDQTEGRSLIIVQMMKDICQTLID